MHYSAQRSRHRADPTGRPVDLHPLLPPPAARYSELVRHPLPVLAALLAGCAGAPLTLHMPNPDTRRYLADPHGGAQAQLRPEVCTGYDLRPDPSALNEASLVRFLQEQRFDVQVQRQPVAPHSPELSFVFVSVPGVSEPVSLRVAILADADSAGRALHDAMLERGSGSWGVHRSNVSVLGPSGTAGDDIAFAATTKLACWGTLTLRDGADAVVIPGGYAEP